MVLLCLALACKERHVAPLFEAQYPDDLVAISFSSALGRGSGFRTPRNSPAYPAPSVYPPPCIIETGTLRDDRDQARYGDGWSTIAWGWYASQTGGRVATIDIDAEAIADCRKRTLPYADFIEYVIADSLTFLRQWQEEERGLIHLLYLDSLDYSEPERSEQHHLLEAQAALPAYSAERAHRQPLDVRLRIK